MQTLDFTASSSTLTLIFASLTAGSQEPALDGVSIFAAAPVITEQPSGHAVSVGKNVIFSTTVIGSSPFLYYWREARRCSLWARRWCGASPRRWRCRWGQRAAELSVVPEWNGGDGGDECRARIRGGADQRWWSVFGGGEQSVGNRHELVGDGDESHAIPTGGTVGGPERGCAFRDEREALLPGERAVRAGAPRGEAGKFQGWQRACIGKADSVG